MSAKYVVDTNILIRLLTKDDDAQVHTILHLITSNRIRLYVTSIVVIETYWVLKSAYQINKEDSVRALISLLESEEVDLEEKEVILDTLYQFSEVNVDLVDVYLAEKAKRSHLPVLTWNKRDFNKLKSEFYTPEQLN
jgi:predicted nucleic-acid-binding protein